MSSSWTFDASGPDTSGLNGPVGLKVKGLGLPNKPGLYLVTCGDCLAHVGTSVRLAERVRTLARLGFHRGSSEVLCTAYCSNQWPLIWWEECSTVAVARQREQAFKNYYGEPPIPRAKYEPCRNGAQLLKDLTQAAGASSWEAGYAEAVFTIGEDLRLLFRPRFEAIWKRIRIPPGPWTGTFLE